MSNSRTEDESRSKKTLDESIKSDLRCLPSLPRTTSSMFTPSNDYKPNKTNTTSSMFTPSNDHKPNKTNTIDDVDPSSQELQRYSYPGTTPKKSKQSEAQTAQLSRILKNFETNLSFFHQREKHVRVEVIVGLEKKLAKFSKTLQGAFLNNGFPRTDNSYSDPGDPGKRMVEWPVCGKYPNCVICSMEIRELVSVSRFTRQERRLLWLYRPV